ncbi:MAG: ParB N-terminal domain-containing protein [Chloroflexi bacterium]|nr:ParB N-terminal domain-containing protein [Chloroflexota bacterium]
MEQIELEKFDTGLSIYRLVLPGQIKMMQQSLERLGQLQPVITRRTGDLYQIIDGFKRYYASEQSGLPSLSSKVFEVEEGIGKAMILAYNREPQSMVDYEEGLIVYSLKKEHMMNQKEISELTGYSQTWVCRRISLIERLDDIVQSQLRMGKLNAAHAREIIKLPRGNQEEIAQVIIGNNISSRQSGWLIEKYLSSGSDAEREYLLRYPKEAIEKATKETEVYDSRLSKHGNRLLKTVELLFHQQHVFIGQYIDTKTDKLSELERSILNPKLKRISEKSGTIVSLMHGKAVKDER